MAYTPNDKGMYQVPLVAFGKRLRDNFGLDIGEHSAFGGNSGGHAPNSFHNYDEAIDIIVVVELVDLGKQISFGSIFGHGDQSAIETNALTGLYL